MANSYKDPFDVSKLLTFNMRDVPAWAQLAEGINEVALRNVINPRRELQAIRDSRRVRKGYAVTYGGNIGLVTRIDIKTGDVGEDEEKDDVTITYPDTDTDVLETHTEQEREFLIRGTFTLGFNVISDQITTEDYLRIFESLGIYYPQSGTVAFLNYIGFIKNVGLTASQLWSYDNGDARVYPALTTIYGTPKWEGGTWFPTSHIELEYNIEQQPDLPETEVRSMFFKLAPIHLVLKSFDGAYFSYEDLYLITINNLLDIEMDFTYTEDTLI